ncbi:WD40 repeat domain-containing serine/threonine protein kinase [Tuwongella immobilis]|uniref:non-specific serine/threonine protein kinase n=1 Tax=Tuwongella immobilis TaxID=692036 RepID=A0A6C2YTY8_9BACT|nr:WD40 repeat domain-containing serine/threonine protein kinase [Tuwongella immobilis]VIP04817.1 wd40 repeat-containing protein : WD40 repeat-containing protein OS=Singulisphaera acidiphila (strain ATCC BAA-1392 / DSM 18658 / VKM B-2454 / MOB10) GN=Sinac_7479 PE=4 SV=1: Pkinase [Tuwongella immobilis]VTS06994.1 wd40 repeat-containing protein : WD40 repeat-containing protein OS=Singulisphaera acidiphila (strain ATCC BAA-1392 / DSM 18658 / VKM B-2454 / MOB10) GN=Sinac_7479 PE=4 SV=1: Pkinase [Tuwon
MTPSSPDPAPSVSSTASAIRDARDSVSVHTIVTLIRGDILRRFQNDPTLRIERYLAEFPELQPDNTSIVDLLITEFQLRLPQEPTLSLRDYQRRFPQLSAALAHRWQRLGEASAAGNAAAAAESPLATNLLPPSSAQEHLPVASPPTQAESWGGFLSITESGSCELPNIPGYRVQRIIQQGGMGIVYEAWQQRLNRRVAIKMVLNPGQARPERMVRFLVEAELVAGLQHPNIVQVYDFGNYQDAPYFVMEFVSGGSLADRLRRADQSFTPTEAAQLVLAVADAMAFAHHRQIIHRDLKPGNILLTETGVPKVTDFGLARRGESVLTQFGTVVGTPAYMAPEQALGQSDSIGPASDIWSIGIILYECLTGRPPFRGSDRESMLAQVVESAVVPVTEIAPRVPASLEAICLCCLAKAPQDRYASAIELAADLRRFLAGQPPRAEPLSRFRRLGRWIKANPMVVGLLGTIVLLVVMMVTLTAGLAIRAREESQRTQQALIAAQSAQEESRNNQREAARQLLRVEWLNHGRILRDVQYHLLEDHVQTAETIWATTRPELRGWECEWLHHRSRSDRRILHPESIEPGSICLSPDGHWLAAGYPDGGVRLMPTLDLALPIVVECASQPLIQLQFAPNEPVLWMVDRTGTVRCLDLQTHQLAEVLQLPEAGCTQLAIAPDGRRVAIAQGESRSRVWIWDIAQREIVLRLEGIAGEIEQLTWNSTADRLALFALPGMLHLHEIPSGQPIPHRIPSESPIIGMHWPPNANTIHVMMASGLLETWSLGSDSTRQTSQRLRSGRRAWSSPDGRRWLIWHQEPGQPPLLRVESLAAGEWKRTIGLPEDLPLRLATNRAGSLLAFAQPDGRIGIVNPLQPNDTELVPSLGIATESVALGPTGRTLLQGDVGGSLRCWDLLQGCERFRAPGHRGAIERIWISPNGMLAVTIGGDKQALVWNLRQGSILQTLTSDTTTIVHGCFDDVGTTLLLARSDGTIETWTTPESAAPLTRQSVFRWESTHNLTGMVMHPRRQWLIVTDAGGRMEMLTVTGQLLREYERHPQGIERIALQPGSSRVMTWCRDGFARFCMVDLRGRETLVHHMPTRPEHWQFTPTGNRLVQVTPDRTVRIFHPEAGEDILTIPNVGDASQPVALSGDERWMAIVRPNGMLRVLDAGDHGAGPDATELRDRWRIDRIHLAEVALPAREPKRAFEWLEQADWISETEPRIAWIRGQAWLQLQRPEPALAQFAAPILGKSPRLEERLCHLLARAQLGDGARAAEELQQLFDEYQQLLHTRMGWQLIRVAVLLPQRPANDRWPWARLLQVTETALQQSPQDQAWLRLRDAVRFRANPHGVDFPAQANDSWADQLLAALAARANGKPELANQRAARLQPQTTQLATMAQSLRRLGFAASGWSMGLACEWGTAIQPATMGFTPLGWLEWTTLGKEWGWNQ